MCLNILDYVTPYRVYSFITCDNCYHNHEHDKAVTIDKEMYE